MKNDQENRRGKVPPIINHARYVMGKNSTVWTSVRALLTVTKSSAYVLAKDIATDVYVKATWLPHVPQIKLAQCVANATMTCCMTQKDPKESLRGKRND